MSEIIAIDTKRHLDIIRQAGVTRIGNKLFYKGKELGGRSSSVVKHTLTSICPDVKLKEILDYIMVDQAFVEDVIHDDEMKTTPISADECPAEIVELCNCDVFGPYLVRQYGDCLYKINVDGVAELLDTRGFMALFTKYVRNPSDWPCKYNHFNLLRNMREFLQSAIARCAIETLDAPPKPIAFSDDPSVCFAKLKFTPAECETCTCQEFNDFIAGMDKKEEFCAWLYGRFIDQPYRKQILWLLGPPDTFKSTFISALCSNFESVYTALDSRDFKSNSYLVANIAGKVIAFIREARGWIIRNEDFKIITGETEGVYRQKYEADKIVPLTTSFIAATNDMPDVPQDRATIGRILFVQLDDSIVGRYTQVDFINAIQSNLEPILGYCRYCYNKLANSDGSIPNDISDLQDIADDLYGDILGKFNEYYKEDKEGRIAIKDFNAWLREAGLGFTREAYRENKAIIMNRYNLTSRSIRIGDDVVKGFKGYSKR